MVDRFAGAQEAARALGLEFTDELVQWGSFSHESGYSGLVHLMGINNRPTAVFCGNDVVAIGAMDAASKIGIVVPRDLSIIGVDDIPMASWSMISLTRMRQSIAEIGTLAARRVAKQGVIRSAELLDTDDRLKAVGGRLSMGTCVHFSRSFAVEFLVANDGWVASPVKAVSRRRRGPQARLCRACHPAILGHRGRRLAT